VKNNSWDRGEICSYGQVNTILCFCKKLMNHNNHAKIFCHFDAFTSSVFQRHFLHLIVETIHSKF